MTHTQSVNRSVGHLGFFSSEICHFRASERARLKAEFDGLEKAVATAIAARSGDWFGIVADSMHQELQGVVATMQFDTPISCTTCVAVRYVPR